MNEADRLGGRWLLNIREFLIREQYRKQHPGTEGVIEPAMCEDHHYTLEPPDIQPECVQSVSFGYTFTDRDRAERARSVGRQMAEIIRAREIRAAAFARMSHTVMLAPDGAMEAVIRADKILASHGIPFEWATWWTYAPRPHMGTGPSGSGWVALHEFDVRRPGHWDQGAKWTYSRAWRPSSGPGFSGLSFRPSGE